MNKKIDNTELKQDVHDFWNSKACGTWEIDKEKFSKEYFEEIEETRYRLHPEIHPFAGFQKAKGLKVLEVGVGAGTDFLQWVRAGAEAYGMDLTEEAIAHVEHRLNLYGLQAAELKVADSENIPYPDNFFDVVYSWGVIHHTPDTEKAMDEIVRVCKPGGEVKVMIYHRHSLLAWFFWIRKAMLKGKPWESVAKVLFDHMESYGTKAYTANEAAQMLAKHSLSDVQIKPVLTYYDKLLRFGAFPAFVSKIAATLLGGDKVGWFLTIRFRKG